MSDATTEPRRCVDVVLGAQWGDEGKGKLIDSLAGSYKALKNRYNSDLLIRDEI